MNILINIPTYTIRGDIIHLFEGKGNIADCKNITFASYPSKFLILLLETEF
jgi:hypothetical protein